MRFAIYAAPGTRAAGAGAAGARAADAAGAALRDRAERWLGRSITGEPVTPGVPAGWARADIDAITVGARRYGFHGTLKAPFRLADGRTPEELDAAVARFAAGRPGAVIPRLSLARLGGFFALVPGAAATGLYALADDVVTGLDAFRAPLTDAEFARRRPERLTPRQRELLKAWGYPYVLEEFRFHLTLTDRIPAERRPAVEHALSGWFAGSLGADVPVAALAVFTEAAPGAPFLLHSLHPLQPVPSPQRAASEGAS